MASRKFLSGKAARLTGQRFSLPAERDNFVLGLFIPRSGPAGIWGPSCRACGELAVHQINQSFGLAGQEVQVRIVDAGADPSQVARQAACLVNHGEIDAIVGMHTSDIREAIAPYVSGRIPYIYTPLYEGGVHANFVCCIGETPETQLFPALSFFVKNFGARRWALVGNDYVWPRRSHNLTRGLLGQVDAEVVFEAYHPFGSTDFSNTLQALEDLRADVVLLSLVGDDSVRFNREFSAARLANQTMRLSCAIEENMLLAIGADHTERLYCSSGYFSQISSSDNGMFKEAYHQYFGDSAPTLNAIAESVYEGVLFLANCLHQDSGINDPLASRSGQTQSTLSIPGPRQAQWNSQFGAVDCSVYLAEAEGHEFAIRGVLNPANALSIPTAPNIRLH